MATTKSKEAKSGNIFLRMHPLQRLLVSLLLTVIGFFVFQHHMKGLGLGLVLWLVFSFPYLVFSWIVFFTRTIGQIREFATKEDGSAPYLFVMVLLSSFASLVSVLLLMTSDEFSKDPFFLFVAIAGMMLSWTMVHSLFTFHYAHMYYDNLPGDKTRMAEGLEFPGNEKPDYIDFAYFSFIIGCTFQVSDVAISSRLIRRMVLLHGLLSFVLNTFVVALTINLIAGLLNN